MRPDKPKTKKGLTPTKRVRPYQFFSRKSVAGVTLLTFLLTQLTWPLHDQHSREPAVGNGVASSSDSHVFAEETLRTETVSQSAGLEELKADLKDDQKAVPVPTSLTDLSAEGVTAGLEELGRRAVQGFIRRLPDDQKTALDTYGVLRLTGNQAQVLVPGQKVDGGVILRLDGANLEQVSGLLFAQPNVRVNVPAGLRDLPWVELADDSVQAGMDLKNARAEFGRDLALFEARDGLTAESIQAGLEANRYENHPRIVLLHSEQAGALTRRLLVYFATAKRDQLPPVVIPILMDVIQDSYGNFYAVASWA